MPLLLPQTLAVARMVVRVEQAARDQGVTLRYTPAVRKAETVLDDAPIEFFDDALVHLEEAWMAEIESARRVAFAARLRAHRFAATRAP